MGETTQSNLQVESEADDVGILRQRVCLVNVGLMYVCSMYAGFLWYRGKYYKLYIIHMKGLLLINVSCA